MNLTNLTAQPRKVEIGGVDYLVGKFNFKHIGQIEGWLKDKFVNPIVAVLPFLAGLDAKDRQFLLEQARKEMQADWPPDLSTRKGVKKLISDPEGQCKLLEVALKIHQPQLTDADVLKIHESLFADGTRSGAEKLNEILAIAFDAEENQALNEVAPKA